MLITWFFHVGDHDDDFDDGVISTGVICLVQDSLLRQNHYYLTFLFLLLIKNACFRACKLSWFPIWFTFTCSRHVFEILVARFSEMPIHM